MNVRDVPRPRNGTAVPRLRRRALPIHSRGEACEQRDHRGIDLAKNVFSLHGVDSHGDVLMRRTVKRSKLLSVVAQLPSCVIGMETCSGAHEWARQFRKRQ